MRARFIVLGVIAGGCVAAAVTVFMRPEPRPRSTIPTIAVKTIPINPVAVEAKQAEQLAAMPRPPADPPAAAPDPERSKKADRTRKKKERERPRRRTRVTIERP